MSSFKDQPSKRIVKCGVCKAELRRDELKLVHFPKYHPGIAYKEKGEQSIKSMFSSSVDSITNSFRKYKRNVDISCESMETDIAQSHEFIVESAVCNKCHQRFNMKDISKHVKNRHENQNTEFSDAFATYSSLKLLHGVCHFPMYNVGKKEFLALALKLAVKTPNEAVVDSIGSVLSLHSLHNRNCLQTTYHNEVMIDWNGPEAE